eukprot:gene14219-2551_t
MAAQIQTLIQQQLAASLEQMKQQQAATLASTIEQIKLHNPAPAIQLGDLGRTLEGIQQQIEEQAARLDRNDRRDEQHRRSRSGDRRDRERPGG